MSAQHTPGPWYCLAKDGMATLCADEDDAKQVAKLFDRDWPRHGPYTAVRLIDASKLDAVTAQRDELLAALKLADAALSDIGDADREPGDDLAWCEARAAKDIPAIRAAIQKVEGK